MTRIYTWNGEQARRTVTIDELQDGKGERKWVQVSANTAKLSAAAAEVGFVDMIICNSVNVEQVREGNNTLFLTAAIPPADFATTDDILREAFNALGKGADAIMTSRNMKVVAALASEGIPVMGHLGLVPHKTARNGVLKPVGKTVAEALELYQNFKCLEKAGALMVVAEMVTWQIMEAISQRTNLITFSLGSGYGADVSYFCIKENTGGCPTPAPSYFYPSQKDIDSDPGRYLEKIETLAHSSTHQKPSTLLSTPKEVLDDFLEKFEQSSSDNLEICQPPSEL